MDETCETIVTVEDIPFETEQLDALENIILSDNAEINAGDQNSDMAILKTNGPTSPDRTQPTKRKGRSFAEIERQFNKKIQRLEQIFKSKKPPHGGFGHRNVSAWLKKYGKSIEKLESDAAEGNIQALFLQEQLVQYSVPMSGRRWNPAVLKQCADWRSRYLHSYEYARMVPLLALPGVRTVVKINKQMQEPTSSARENPEEPKLVKGNEKTWVIASGNSDPSSEDSS